jgi:hypothetical protein
MKLLKALRHWNSVRVLRVYRRWLWILLSSDTWCNLVWYKFNNLLEETATFIFYPKKEAADSSETSVKLYQTTRCQINRSGGHKALHIPYLRYSSVRESLGFFKCSCCFHHSSLQSETMCSWLGLCVCRLYIITLLNFHVAPCNIQQVIKKTRQALAIQIINSN